MTRFLLDPTLSLSTLRSWRTPPQVLKEVQDSVSSRVSPYTPQNKGDPRRVKMVRPLAEPSDSRLLGGSFIRHLEFAYNNHCTIAFGPHDFWYIVLTEVASVIRKDPERYRDIFTTSQDKQLVTVLTGSVEELPLASLMEALSQRVPSDTSLFFPKFSTQTPDCQLACMAAFADAVSDYYSYGTYMCGLRGVEVLGTPEDWLLFGDRVVAVTELLGEPKVIGWGAVLSARAERIAASLDGGDPGFYLDLFKSRNVGSGSQRAITGWCTELYVSVKPGEKIENFPSQWSEVKYQNLETKREFSAVYGCFYADVTQDPDGNHVLTPAYGSTVVERIDVTALEPEAKSAPASIHLGNADPADVASIQRALPAKF